MIVNERDLRQGQARDIAEKMLVAARTAPKGKGVDIIECAVADGDDKQRIADEMRAIAAERGFKFFLRDALNVYPALAEFSKAAPEYWLGRAAEKLAGAEAESDALADALGDMLGKLGAKVNGTANALGEDLTQTIQAGCELILGEIEWW